MNLFHLLLFVHLGCGLTTSFRKTSTTTSTTSSTTTIPTASIGTTTKATTSTTDNSTTIATNSTIDDSTTNSTTDNSTVIATGSTADNSTIIANDSTSDNSTIIAADSTSDNSTTNVTTVTTPETTTIPACTTTETPKIRQCMCEEVAECREFAFENVTSCFEECHHALDVLGKETQNFIECFEKNEIGMTQSEICLRDQMGDGVCNNGNETNMIEIPNYDDYKGFGYRNSTNKADYSPLHKKTHKTFHVFQRFYHCSKHCVHKRMIECYQENECAVALPPKESFVGMMESCAKTHKGAANNLMKTCRCLLFQKKVSSLFGQCGLMGIPFIINKF